MQTKEDSLGFVESSQQFLKERKGQKSVPLLFAVSTRTS